jgi:hypothetical protein
MSACCTLQKSRLCWVLHEKCMALSLCCRVSTYGGCIICSRHICIVAECPILHSAKSWAFDNFSDSGSAEEVNTSEYEQQKTLENSKMLPLESRGY